MKTILCTGDSHTWGQGAAGVLEGFDPPVQAGELRLTDFRCDSYVNLLRRKVEEATGSFSKEWEAPCLTALFEVEYRTPCACIGIGQQAAMSFTGALMRVEYSRAGSPCRFEVEIDGETSARREEPVASGGNDFHILTMRLPDGTHRASFKVTEGELLLYRIETYGGAFCVVNAGVGSCPSFRYRERYFEDYVTAVRPDIVLAEAHTINDWIAGAPPWEYVVNLKTLLEDFRNLGAETILMTVSPIAGEQARGGFDYREYVEASRQAARMAGVRICDANRMMELGLAELEEGQSYAWLFEDDWHPNGRGHAIYAELLFQALCQREVFLPDFRLEKMS